MLYYKCHIVLGIYVNLNISVYFLTTSGRKFGIPDRIPPRPESPDYTRLSDPLQRHPRHDPRRQDEERAPNASEGDPKVKMNTPTTHKVLRLQYSPRPTRTIANSRCSLRRESLVGRRREEIASTAWRPE